MICAVTAATVAQKHRECNASVVVRVSFCKADSDPGHPLRWRERVQGLWMDMMERVVEMVGRGRVLEQKGSKLLIRW